jgi:nitronate monooxygenase
MLNIPYPIVQAPMLGVSSPAMVAAICAEGGLGSLPVGGLSPDVTRKLIRAVKQLTNKPFAVNLFAHENAIADQDQLEAMRKFLLELCGKHGLHVEIPAHGAFIFHNYREQIDILLEENVPVVSFTFGVLDPGSIDRLHNAGTVLAGTATSQEEAAILDAAGIDVITIQGIAAGGHRGTFASDSSLPEVATIDLLQQVVASTAKPVIAAGGIVDGDAIGMALRAGAAGVQAGTVFLAGRESLAAPAYQTAILEAPIRGTVLTKAFSGRWARVIPNILVREVESNGPAILPYPVQAALTAPIRLAAQQQGDREFLPLFAGESGAMVHAGTCAEIFSSLLRQAEEA